MVNQFYLCTLSLKSPPFALVLLAPQLLECQPSLVFLKLVPLIVHNKQLCQFTLTGKLNAISENLSFLP